MAAGNLPDDAPVTYVAAYGASYHRRVEVAHAGTRWVFLYHPDDRVGLQFRAGIFVDAASTPGRHLARVPAARRAAVLVETPNQPQFARFPAAAVEFAVVLTHLSHLRGRGGPFRRLDYGTRWVPAGDPATVAAGMLKRADVSFFGSVEHDDRFGYRLRKEVAAALAARGVPCFGKGIRPLPQKADGLTPYRFSVAMENVRAAGYYTEKLIDCFECGTVPVYWGDPTIEETFESRGLVTFETLPELLDLLPTLAAEQYETMRPHLAENLRRADSLDVRDGAGLHRRIAAALEEFIPPGVFRPRTRWWAAVAAALNQVGGRRAVAIEEQATL
ncbi:glycosyltransferase family 10 domain-containing protein [Alienimonas chondri]|nr:glycosyltransferase family 10 [Alienimonas chondri]